MGSDVTLAFLLLAGGAIAVLASRRVDFEADPFDDVSRSIPLDDLRVEPRREWATRPEVLAGALAALLLALAAYRIYEPLPAGTWPELGDSRIFEYIGWYLTEGNRLYVDVWEVKPPLSFEITALLSYVAGDDVVLYHVLNVLVTSGAAVLAAAAAAGIVRELTGDPLGAVAAGVATFTIPPYFYRAVVGFKAKYFVIAAGLWCLYLAYRKRPRAAGVAGAAAVGFWQLAVVFPVAALGLCWQLRGRDGAKRFCAAGIATGGVILLPVVAWGAVPAMIAEAVLTPLLVTSDSSVTDNVQLLARILGRALPIALLGMAGIAEGFASDRYRREWPIALAAAWFTVQLLFLDFDSSPDVFPWFAVLAVGAGLAVASGRRRVRRPVDASDPVRGSADSTANGPTPETADSSADDPVSTNVFGRGSRALATMILLMAVVSVATLGGYATGNTTYTSPDTYDLDTDLDPELQGARTYNATENQYVYWNRVEIPTCRALGARTQYRLVNEIGLAQDEPWYEADCGRFDPVWAAFVDKYAP